MAEESNTIYEEGTPEYDRAVAARGNRWKSNGVNDNPSYKESSKEIDSVLKNTEQYEKTGRNQYESGKKTLDEVLENTEKYNHTGRNQYDKRDAADRMYDDLKSRVNKFNEGRKIKHQEHIKKMVESDKKLEQELRVREKHNHLIKRKSKLDRGHGFGGLNIGTPKGGGTGLSFSGGMGGLNLGSPGGLGVGLGFGSNGGLGLNLGLTDNKKVSNKKDKKQKKNSKSDIIIHIKK
jgi:hypothetical protein